ncbi:MAG TPA: hypothetical protein VNO14_11860, partial [Blastocatellia bacterium]|nr:hypothetical protein [Blastocatellia bacterium]
MDRTREASEDFIVGTRHKNASPEKEAKLRSDVSGGSAGSGATTASRSHPSRSLGPRSRGYGIGG